uniref:DUF1758 domain-containing protein n=1 Tax=Wuchereria bancrofti TaxID=6293 RepID=A0AAF5PI96_WUCBA
MQCLQQSMGRTSRNNSETDRISSQQEQGPTEIRRQLIVKLPRLALKNFDGNPKQWREFWSGFEAAVHQQNLADVQKLTYLLSCLRGTALNAVEGYETTPENYETIRNILIERFGSPSIVKRALHHELQSFRHNDRDLRTTVETIERILRQLANLGENVEQTSIELAIEEKLPRWVLDEVYKKKELDPNCENLNIAGFGKEKPINFQTMKTVVGIRLTNEETIQMEVNTVDYLTNDLQVADLSEQNLEQLNELHGEWKKPDLLIGANYFFNFIEPSKAKRINSGFYLVEAEVGPIVAGYGQINNANSNIMQVEIAIVFTAINRNVPDVDQFWNLELTGVKEEPEATYDDKALSRFKRSIG